MKLIKPPLSIYVAGEDERNAVQVARRRSASNGFGTDILYDRELNGIWFVFSNRSVVFE